MTAETDVPARYETTRKLTSFARKHPMLTLVGLGGAALVGGVELAAGVVIGAGIDAMLRRQRPHAEPHEAPSMREQSRRMMSRAPTVIRERARAVVDAARGRPVGATTREEPVNPEQAATD